MKQGDLTRLSLVLFLYCKISGQTDLSWWWLLLPPFVFLLLVYILEQIPDKIIEKNLLNDFFFRKELIKKKILKREGLQ